MEETETGRRFDQLLEKNNLKKTQPRLSVLKVLASRKTATSQPALEEILGAEIDRVTLYRVLRTFEEKGIIHKVIDLNGTANYATCDESCTEHAHDDRHVHFNCTHCLHVYCLDSLHIPALTMPAGFTASQMNLIVYGICEECNEKER
ncbi:Fur family transcriptional regulator [Pedobacter sp. SYSU D00535]|uniref:Fur family transcriptional regulator n=1 Tax=Pedobacter sp. SYSU D00535 TaxID=2810308 RepID=UPI001A9707BE|nr:transcriptional repressor [Pedobacter sp. SYSU D00535]